MSSNTKSIKHICRGLKSGSKPCTKSVNLDNYPNGYCSYHQMQASKETRITKKMLEKKRQAKRTRKKTPKKKIIKARLIKISKEDVKDIVKNLYTLSIERELIRNWDEASGGLNVADWLLIASFLTPKDFDSLCLSNKALGNGILKDLSYYRLHPSKGKYLTPSLYKAGRLEGW